LAQSSGLALSPANCSYSINKFPHTYGGDKLVSASSFGHDTCNDEVEAGLMTKQARARKELEGTRAYKVWERRVKLDIVTLSIRRAINYTTHIVLLVSGTRSHGRIV
jgi:hypothetical protein